MRGFVLHCNSCFRTSCQACPSSQVLKYDDSSLVRSSTVRSVTTWCCFENFKALLVLTIAPGLHDYMRQHLRQTALKAGYFHGPLLWRGQCFSATQTEISLFTVVASLHFSLEFLQGGVDSMPCHIHQYRDNVRHVLQRFLGDNYVAARPWTVCFPLKVMPFLILVTGVSRSGDRRTSNHAWKYM